MSLGLRAKEFAMRFEISRGWAIGLRVFRLDLAEHEVLSQPLQVDHSYQKLPWCLRIRNMRRLRVWGVGFRAIRREWSSRYYRNGLYTDYYTDPFPAENQIGKRLPH